MCILWICRRKTSISLFFFWRGSLSPLADEEKEEEGSVTSRHWNWTRFLCQMKPKLTRMTRLDKKMCDTESVAGYCCIGNMSHEWHCRPLSCVVVHFVNCRALSRATCFPLSLSCPLVVHCDNLVIAQLVLWCVHKRRQQCLTDGRICLTQISLTLFYFILFYLFLTK